MNLSHGPITNILIARYPESLCQVWAENFEWDEDDSDDIIDVVAAAHRHSLAKLKEWCLQCCLQDLEEDEEFLEDLRTDERLAAYPDLVEELSNLGAGARADDNAVQTSAVQAIPTSRSMISLFIMRQHDEILV